MAQSIKRLTLDFGSGHDLRVRGFKLHIGFCGVSMWSLLGILSLPLSAPAPLVVSLSLSLKRNNLKNK